MIILFIVSIIVLAIANSLLSFGRILIGAKTYHLIETLIRGAIITLIASFVSTTTIKLLGTAITGFLLFWILFDIFLNILKGNSLLFVESRTWVGRQIHRIFPKNTGVWLLGVKLVILIAAIILNI